MPRVVVVGAGVGGLSAAAVLARHGLEVTVLEAHVYAGGCAGTFFHQGYRFDAGATLACGFYPGGPMERLSNAAGIPGWPVQQGEPAMAVHLPGGLCVERRGDESRWAAYVAAFGRAGERFFRWQEARADALWDLALRLPPWLPQTMAEALALGREGLSWLGGDVRARLDPRLALDAFRPVAAHLRGAPDPLRRFVDAQLLISAQTGSERANALYGAAALDLPRRGVVHLKGGMGTLAGTLVDAVRQNGGQVQFRQEVTRLVAERRAGAPAFQVETNKGASFPADLVIANLPPWDAARLWQEPGGRPPQPRDGWGAFIVYLGLDGSAVPAGYPLHHQVVVREPLGEGNTVFLSLSPAWDASRAPAGRRALTISTHTRLGPWWRLFEQDREAYEARVAAYTERTLQAAELALPGLREAADLILPGTPVTFQRFTRRSWGWVGGFPQTGLFRTRGPRLAPNLWLVGDSIFPGQSVAAVALGGLRVAKAIVDRRQTQC